MTTWHDSAKARKAIGDALEAEFEQRARCECGGRFRFVGSARPGFPDYTCGNCGRLVDIKDSPQKEMTGNIAVSQRPFDGYPDDMLLATKFRGKWVAEYRRNVRTSGGVHNATHQERATRFYLIACGQLRPIEQFGITMVQS